MATPDQERMDALSEALASMLRRQGDLDLRLARVEEALHLKSLRADSLAPTPEPEPMPVAAETAAPHPPPLPPPVRLETKIGLTLVSRIGAVTLVLGIAF